MRRAARTDDNHGAVIDALRKAGWSVWSTAALGKGFADAIAAKNGRTLLLEIKDGRKPPSARKLTPAETAFHASWPGELYIVESVEAALQAVR